MFAIVLFIYLVSGLRAHRERRLPPSPRRLTVVFTVMALLGVLLSAASHRGDVAGLLGDIAVAVGTMFVVTIAIAIPLSRIQTRSMSPMSAADIDRMFEAQRQDMELTTKLFVATHGLALSPGVLIIAALMIAALAWALSR